MATCKIDLCQVRTCFFLSPKSSFWFFGDWKWVQIGIMGWALDGFFFLFSWFFFLYWGYGSHLWLKICIQKRTTITMHAHAPMHSTCPVCTITYAYRPSLASIQGHRRERPWLQELSSCRHAYLQPSCLHSQLINRQPTSLHNLQSILHDLQPICTYLHLVFRAQEFTCLHSMPSTVIYSLRSIVNSSTVNLFSLFYSIKWCYLPCHHFTTLLLVNVRCQLHLANVPCHFVMLQLVF